MITLNKYLCRQRRTDETAPVQMRKKIDFHKRKPFECTRKKKKNNFKYHVHIFKPTRVQLLNDLTFDPVEPPVGHFYS
jgi:hypothetical protein